METCSLTCGPGLQKHNPTCCCCSQDNGTNFFVRVERCQPSEWNRVQHTCQRTGWVAPCPFKNPGLWFWSSAHPKLYPCLCVDLLSRVSKCLKVPSQPLRFQANHLLPPNRNRIHHQASGRPNASFWKVDPAKVNKTNLKCLSTKHIVLRHWTPALSRDAQCSSWRGFGCAVFFFLWSHISANDMINWTVYFIFL